MALLGEIENNLVQVDGGLHTLAFRRLGPEYVYCILDDLSQR